ncbi:hypothetical protein [Streptococcus oricebi]|uniref:Uncharacterized protein n=1 Tax=Streptococcus oricebi TaxID=1547447 RepID=A0ABS5B0Y0_9STRE|nr:hypothetical protein [Streptococcus oricebi]MBP2622326.1 hypothetical protein [Streptococcus oricebi]
MKIQTRKKLKTDGRKKASFEDKIGKFIFLAFLLTFAYALLSEPIKKLDIQTIDKKEDSFVQISEVQELPKSEYRSIYVEKLQFFNLIDTDNQSFFESIHSFDDYLKWLKENKKVYAPSRISFNDSQLSFPIDYQNPFHRGRNFDNHTNEELVSRMRLSPQDREKYQDSKYIFYFFRTGDSITVRDGDLWDKYPTRLIKAKLKTGKREINDYFWLLKNSSALQEVALADIKDIMISNTDLERMKEGVNTFSPYGIVQHLFGPWYIHQNNFLFPVYHIKNNYEFLLSNKSKKGKTGSLNTELKIKLRYGKKEKVFSKTFKDQNFDEYKEVVLNPKEN